MKNIVVHTRIDEKLATALERLSVKDDRTKSHIIREALRKFFGLDTSPFFQQYKEDNEQRL